MDLVKLYKAQAKLDVAIIEKKNLQGEDLIQNKLLALYVELGELAQEVQGDWKYWKSHTTADFTKTLYEFVDCLHFALSIGNDLNFIVPKVSVGEAKSVKLAFLVTFKALDNFATNSLTKKWYDLLIHELFMLAFTIGLTPFQIKTAYFRKNKVNHRRQEADY
jgi:dimeric dUTPase (all-alpha-NTP-PPase superfamily)